MANQADIARVCLEEAILLSTTGGNLETQILPLLRVAHRALAHGDVTKDDVEATGIHPTKLSRLGML